MPATLESLKDRLGLAAGRIPDEALERLLASAAADYGLTDPLVVLTLALALCYQRLAAESAGNFRFSQADESVDKTGEAAQWRALFDQTWASLPESVRERGTPQPDTFVLGGEED